MVSPNGQPVALACVHICANKKHWEGFVSCVHYENFVDVEYMVDPMESGPSGGCLERVDTMC